MEEASRTHHELPKQQTLTSSIESGNSRPKLTICIPTYNRAAHLENLLKVLVTQILPIAEDSVDVVVVNNASTDTTRVVLEQVSHPRIRSVHRQTFLLTAEENIIHSLEYCTGEYVWFLGDDDIPITANFREHLNRIRRDDADYLIFNAALIDKDGTPFTTQTLHMNRMEISGYLADVILSAGCLFVFAGISNLIIRRSRLSHERGLFYLSASRIYSMVAWLIEGGAYTSAVLINRPLVYYRENDYSSGHWERIATRMEVGDYYFWSIGLVQLFSRLIENGSLTWWQMGQIFDVTRDGVRYRMIDDIVYKLYQQVVSGAKTDADERQKLSVTVFESCKIFCLKADPLLFDLMQELTSIYTHVPQIAGPSRKGSLRSIAIDPGQKFLELFSARQERGQWLCRVEQVFMGYEILWTPTQYVAIRAGLKGLRERVMQYVDPIAQPPFVYVAESRDELLDLVTSRVAAEPEGIRQASCSNGGDLTSPETPMHAAMLAQLAASNQLITAIYNSDSWAFTYPFRAFGRLLRQAVRLTGAMLRLIPALLGRR